MTLVNDATQRVVIRPMLRGDLGRVVEIHLAAFPGFFLSFLGARFLRLLYSEAVALGEPAFVAEYGEEVVGFVMGSRRPGAFYKQILRRRAIAFAVASAPALVRQPGAALRIARALMKPAQARRPAGVATLMSLGVDPGTSKRGAGRALVTAFLEEAAGRGAVTVDLTTDKHDNERVNRFYQQLGFRVAREIVTPERRVMNEYEIDVSAR